VDVRGSQIVGAMLLFMRQPGAQLRMAEWHRARGCEHAYAHEREGDGSYATSTIQKVKTAISTWCAFARTSCCVILG
jgi:hypothetical protein